MTREIVNAEGSELLLKEYLQVSVTGLVWYIPYKDVHDSHRPNSAWPDHFDDAFDGYS